MIDVNRNFNLKIKEYYDAIEPIYNTSNWILFLLLLPLYKLVKTLRIMIVNFGFIIQYNNKRIHEKIFSKENEMKILRVSPNFIIWLVNAHI